MIESCDLCSVSSETRQCRVSTANVMNFAQSIVGIEESETSVIDNDGMETCRGLYVERYQSRIECRGRNYL
jgi:hypothetical protein